MQVQQRHRLLEQEHLLLQQKLSSATARADADSESTRQLLIRVSHMEQQLPEFKSGLALLKEHSRQLQDENTRLRQVRYAPSLSLVFRIPCGVFFQAEQLDLQIYVQHRRSQLP